jgi:UDP-glucuronate 4-epimerase
VRRRGEAAFLKGDIRDPGFVDSAFAEFRPEAIIHLAARAGVRPSLENPLLYEQVNVGGTVTLLEACRKRGVGKFVFASSSSVYGIANRVPFREDDERLRPISPYAATKIAGEKLAFTYSHLYGLRVVCLRFFTVYGPRQRPDLAIRKFIELIEAGREIPVFGDGSMGRDYTFVSDTVDGILAALGHDCAYDVFNLGNSSPVLLSTMVTTIAEAVGREAIIRRLPEQPGDVPITYADLTKSKAVLGYDPKVPFAEGIRRTVEWIRGQ